MLERLFHFMSIKGKLTAVMMSVTAVVLFLATLAFVVNEAVTFRAEIHRELRVLATIIGQNTSAAILFEDRASADTTLSALSARPNLNGAYIVKPDGVLFARYLPKGSGDSPSLFSAGADLRQAMENLATIAQLERESARRWEWDNDLEAVERIVLDNQEIGIVVIRSDLGELFARLKWFFVLVLIVTAFALGIAFLLSKRMHGPISGPILELAHMMRAVSEERNYSLRAARKSQDEIGQLIDGFNDMLAQIQKRDEELGRAASELKESNEDLKGFIYSAAHDLRQPLVNIKGFAGELTRSVQELGAVAGQHPGRFSAEERKKIDDICQNEMQAAMRFIGSSVEKMDDLINALLKLSQLGHQAMKPQRIDMNALVRKVRESLTHQIREQNAALTIGNLPEAVADWTAMEQVMSNLLDNALKYIPHDRRGAVDISGEKTDTETIYHVRDNGRGISRDDLPKLFKIFRRLGAQDVPGQGVGLAYVKTLVRRHGGRIWCESEPGKGSAFSFSIPGRNEEDDR